MPHPIRLRGHWESTPADAGVVRWVRRFGRPTGGVGVDLRVVAANFPCRVRVNGGVVHEVADSTVAIRLNTLMPRNELAVEMAAGAEPEALLEIRETP